MTELETIHVDRGFAFGVVPGVVVVVWRLPVTHENFAIAADAFDRAAVRAGDAFAFLSIAEPTSSPPSPSVIAEINAFMTGLPGLRASASVLEGRPAWLAFGIDMNHRITAAIARRRRAKVCVDAREAITWLMRQHDLGIDEPYRSLLLDAIEQLRRQIPPL